MTSEIVSIPIASIEVLNPRARNRKIFEELVDSIRAVGLKRPVTVRRSPGKDGYELVCGQGRMEALVRLGATEIPAVVIEATREECFVMSLVENMARRNLSPLELIREIGVLRERGYGNAEIAEKVGFSTEYVYSINILLEKGEERLLNAVERGIIPHTIAAEIARAKEADVQAALMEAYKSGTLPGDQVLAIRRIVDDRNLNGKSMRSIFEIHGMKKSRETIRTWMIEEGLWAANRADRRRIHQPRKRCSSYGESVQIDGSDHDWFEGRGARCTLMVMIDDATSRIQHAAFVERENVEAYLSAGSAYIQQYGRPIRFVTDRHAGAWVTGGKSDFTLALTDLAIAHSVAFSAQSKGRVERANRTLQDRLVKALRRGEVANIEDANAYLPNFLKDYNRKFSIQPISPVDYHREVSSELIFETFVRRMWRRVSRRMTVSIFGRVYSIDPSAFDIVRPNRDIDIRISLDGRITAYFGEKPVPLKPCW